MLAKTALLLSGLSDKEAALLASLAGRIYHDAPRQNAVPLDREGSQTRITTRMPRTRRYVLSAMQVIAFAQAAAQSDTVRARLAFVSGDDHLDPGLYGRISGIAVASDGRVVVSDGANVQLVVLDAKGMLLGTIGRRGRGPGEFTYPVGPAWLPGNRLLVRDVYGVTIFRMPSSGVKGYRYESSFPGPLMPSATLPSRIDQNGQFYYPYQVMGRSEPSSYFYFVYDLNGNVLDTVKVPRYANHVSPAAWVRTGPSGGRIVEGLNAVPFGRKPSWDISAAGTLLASDGRTYEVTEVGRNGQTLRQLRRTVTERPIPARERSDSLASLTSRLDSLPVAASQVRGLPPSVRDKILPASFPAIIQIISATDGRIWVKRWASRGSAFDVFDRDGRFSTTVVCDARISDDIVPAVTRTTLTGLVVEESGAHTVVQFNFRIHQ